MIFYHFGSPTMAKDAAAEDLSRFAVKSESRDSEGSGKWSRKVFVGPESNMNRDTDFNAFSFSSEDQFKSKSAPESVLAKLNKTTNMATDKLKTITTLEEILLEKKCMVLEGEVNSITDTILNSVSDSQLTISQKGVQVMDIFVGLAGKWISPHLSSITSKVLMKLGSTRRNVKLKSAIMSLFRKLMDNVGPMLTLNAISEQGLQNKNSRIREESVNIITMALLHCQCGEVQLLNVARDVVKSMADTRARVRQAAFEAIALISSQLLESDLRQIISMIVEVHRTSEINQPSRTRNKELNLVDAFQARNARKLVPKLDNQGLVQYSVPVLKPSVEVLFSGPDVDWISAGSGGSASAPLQADSNSPPQQSSSPKDSSHFNTTAPPPSSQASSHFNTAPPPPSSQGSSQLNAVVPPSSSFRPYRSAGKRPWETDGKQEVGVSAPPPFTPTSISTPSTVSATPITGSAIPSTKKLPANSYLDLHLSKLNRNAGGTMYNTTVPKSQQNIFSKKSLAGIGSTAGADEKLNSIPTSGLDSGTSKRNVVLDHRDSTFSMILQHPSEEELHSDPHHASGGAGNPMSLTWPRSNLGGLGAGTSVSSGGMALGGTSVPPLKGPVQINADPLGVAGVQSTVKTSFSRPPSKPRVRNPLTSLKSHNQGQGISPPLSGIGCPIPNIGSTSKSSTDSPTSLEKEFLLSGGSIDITGKGFGHTPPWGEGGGVGEEEYFMIPEDTAILDSSLTSSLSSLCGMKDLEASPDVDKLKHIRKEAASRKAQILSASTSATNSPESPRHASGFSADHAAGLKPHTDLPPNKPLSNPVKVLKPAKKNPPPQMIDLKPGPFLNKWNALDADRVYGGVGGVGGGGAVGGVGVGRDAKEEKTYSQAFAKKLFNASNKTHKAGGIQSKRDREKGVSSGPSHGVTEEPDSATLSLNISLEGHGLDHGDGGTKDTTQQQKKKVKKSDTTSQSHSKNRTTISLSLYGNQDGGSMRPTIERGGTNTISMEVSGVGSRSSSLNEGQSLLSQTTKDSIIHKKQKYQASKEESCIDQQQQGKAMGTPMHSSSAKKPPLPAESQENVPTNNVVSAPAENGHRRSKHRKHTDGRTSSRYLEISPQNTPRSKSNHAGGSGRSSLTITEMDLSGGGSGGSPMELDNALLESQVHANPEQAVKTALQSMSSEDWSSKCEGLGMVMCMARNYPHLLQPHLHTVILTINKEVKNLRSSVAKKAIECVSVLFSTMKRAMEPDLDTVVQVLLNKGGEANAFLREVVERAMGEMINNVGASKALTALILGGMSNRNMHVRRIMAKYICGVIESFEPSKFLHASREMVDRALTTVIQLAKDGSPDARYYARRSLSKLVDEPDFNATLSRLKGNIVHDSKEVLDALRTRGVGDPPSESSSAKGFLMSGGSTRHPTSNSSLRTSASSTPQHDLSPRLDSTHRYSSSNSTASSTDSHRKSRRHHHHHHHHGHTSSTPSQQEMSLPDGLAERMQANSWSERDEAITELERYVVGTLPQTMSPQLHKVFDAFCSRLTDRNSKVNLHALQAFSNMVPVLHSALVPIISSIMGTLVPNLASRNLTIHSTAMTVLDLLSQHIDAVHLLPTVANSSQFGNSRVQPIMTKILANLTASAYAQKPQMVQRLVLPVVWHHVSGKMPLTGEAKATLQGLCKVLLDCMGQGFIDSASHLSVEDQRKFESLLEHWIEAGSR